MNIITKSSLSYTFRSGQVGIVLVVTLIMLLLLSLIGNSAMRVTLLEEKMAANQQEHHKALLSAESAARYAWSQLGTDFNTGDFTNNASNSGLYDLRSTGVVSGSGNKLMADWNAVTSATTWPWADATKRDVMPNKVNASDPMTLATAPQYIIGMHEPILRKGTENRWCFPVTIIGAGNGSTVNSRAYIVLKGIPKNGCYRDLVR